MPRVDRAVDEADLVAAGVLSAVDGVRLVDARKGLDTMIMNEKMI